jgi:hypothetical protein
MRGKVDMVYQYPYRQDEIIVRGKVEGYWELAELDIDY